MYDGINKLYDGTKVYTGKLNGSIFTTDDGKEIPFTSSNVYNGQDSVLWINFRKCFQKEIRENYQSLRSTHKAFSSESISNMFSEYQKAWAEVIWNIDQRIKYLLPFFGGADYLKMAQGNKEAQRDFWLFNAFKYRDSKYQTGDAKENSILLRLYNKGEIHVKPYSHIYARVQFGNAKDETRRAWRNEEVVFDTEGIAAVNDLETYVYSADRISDLGDLSDFKIGLCDFSSASKLSRIILGRDEEGYANGNLKSLTLGKNGLLNEIDISNCYNLTKSIDASGCYGLEKFKARGSRITSVNFSDGGRLKEIILPETTSNLTLKNQTEIESLVIDSYDNLTTIHLENTPTLPIESLILDSPNLERVRLYNVEWNATSEAKLREVVDKLKNCKGISATGQDESKAAVYARVHVTEISDAFLEELNSIFPELIVVINGVAKYYIKYVDIDNTELYHYIANEGENVIDPVEKGLIEQPDRAPSEDTIYYYEGWRILPENISQSYVIVAKYRCDYRVRFFAGEGAEEPSNIQWIPQETAALDPVENGIMEIPTKEPSAEFYYEFKDWGVDLSSIKKPLELYPVFNELKNLYVVQIFGGQKQLGDNQMLEYNDVISLPTEGVHNYYYNEELQDYEYFTIYEHSGWDINKDGIDDGNNLRVLPEKYTTEPIIVRALFSAENFVTNDSWAQIAAACEDGSYKAKYPLGTQKSVEFTYGGQNYVGVAEIVDYDYDKLATPVNGKERASLTFMLRNAVVKNTIRNNSSFTWTTPEGESIVGNLAGGFLNTGIFERTRDVVYLDSDLNANIKLVQKKYDQGPRATNDQENYYPATLVSLRTWTPSATEMGVVPDYITKLETYQEADQGGDGTRGAYVWFTNNASRRKTLDGLPVKYWVRTYAASTWRLLGVNDDGGIATDDNQEGLRSYSYYGVVFGFCL